MVIILTLLTLSYCQFTVNTIQAILTPTYNSPPLLNLTFTNSLNTVPSFQIFTAFTQVSYQISNNTNNQQFIIQPISPSNLLAEKVSLMFNQPLSLNLSVDSFVLTVDVDSGYFTTLTGPLVLCVAAFLMSIYGNGGIMMVQYLQVFTELKAINLFYYSFIHNARNALFFNWKPIIFQSLDEDSFLNSCFFMMVIYIFSAAVTVIVWKVIRDPTNPVLKWIKRVFNYSFIIVIFKITMIPFGAGLINNFLWLIKSKPPASAALVANQICCIAFAICYLAVFGFIVWFMHYSKIENYYENTIHTAYRKLYMEIETNKGYKRFYAVFLYFKALLMAVACTFQYGVTWAVVLEDVQILMLMITRPFRTYRYNQLMLFVVSTQFLCYLLQSADYMYKHLGITLLENRGYFIIDTISLVFFTIVWFSLFLLSIYEAYTKIRSFLDNLIWERRQSDRMIEMSRLVRRESLAKGQNSFVSRSRNGTRTV